MHAQCQQVSVAEGANHVQLNLLLLKSVCMSLKPQALQRSRSEAMSSFVLPRVFSV